MGEVIGSGSAFPEHYLISRMIFLDIILTLLCLPDMFVCVQSNTWSLVTRVAPVAGFLKSTGGA